MDRENHGRNYRRRRTRPPWTHVGFVELDPQGNATEGLEFADAYNILSPNLLDVATGLESSEIVLDLVVEHDEMMWCLRITTY